MSRTIFAGTFKQRIRDIYGTKEGISGAVLSVGISADGTVYAGTAEGTFIKDGDSFGKTSSKSVSRFFMSKSGTLFAACGSGVFSVCGRKLTPAGEFDCPVIGLAEDDYDLWLATENDLFKYTDGRFNLYCGNEMKGMKLLAAYGEHRVYESDGVDLHGLWGKRPRWGLIASETSDMPEFKITALAADGLGALWLGTDKGAFIYDGRVSWFGHEELDFLPPESITSLCLDSVSGKAYFGIDGGIYVIDGTRRSFLAAERWIPGGKVVCIAPDADGGIWAGTENGLSHISMTEMTLEKKAEFFEKTAEKYHIREGCFCGRVLTEKGNIESGAVCISDNDGLWTANYIVSEACRYAVTGSEDALNKARTSFKALIKLHKVTENPGFPARAYRRPGEPGYGDGHPEWHPTKDEKGELEWLGETSSDEIMGHYFGLSYYYDLIADEDEKKLITATVKAMTDHILEHDYSVCDVDGLPTTWGRWSPELLNRDDMWRWERGINSLELLTILKTAFVMTGDEKYNQKYYELIEKERYAINSARHKMEDGHSCHIDDHLSTYVTFVLLKYEKNPAVLRYILAGLRHFWNYERIERSPYWSVLFGAFSGECSDLDRAVTSLEELPLDFINYPIKNSVRELEWTDEAIKYGGCRQLKEPLPYDEKPVNGYDCNPFIADSGNGFEAAEPTIYLLPYWLGRYFGLFGD